MTRIRCSVRLNFLFLLLPLLITGCRTANTGASSQPDGVPRTPNVLFIAVDDLRPQLGCYGKSQMKTPHIDRLASTGMLFERAFAMVPTCGASRASLMTGLKPARDRFLSYDTWAERDAPGIPALNDHFKKHGYSTVSLGKVYHHAGDHSEGWDEIWRPNTPRTYVLEKNIRKLSDDDSTHGAPFERAAKPVTAYADGRIASRAIEEMKELSSGNNPWFLAVGFQKPHLPFAAPEKFWQKYDPGEVHLPPNYERPKNVPDAAMHNFGELRSYHGVPDEGPVSDEMARKLIHGYYAATSFADAMVGRVLNALREQGLKNDTVVVLWGDHGWQLGEHALWCKHSVFETSMHAPLLVRAPGYPSGTRTRSLTSFIDIYPSLCELAGLPKPDHLDGRSFVPLLKNPDQSIRKAVYGRFHSGESIRTDRYRYSLFGKGSAAMLFDHQVDPAETVNIAGRKDTKAEEERLRSLLIDRMGHTGRFR